MHGVGYLMHYAMRRHLLVVPPGPQLLSDLVNGSAILSGDRGIPDEVLAETTNASAGGAAGGFEFGVDPSLDPELAMVRCTPLNCAYSLLCY